MKPIIMAGTIRGGRGKKKRRISILAYSGGVLRGVAGYGAVIVDLAGLTVPESLPLNLDHGSGVRDLAGGGRPKNDGRRLTVSGTLNDAEAGRLVVEILEGDTPLQASIEVEPITTRELRAGEEIEVNGQVIEVTTTTVVVDRGQLLGVALVQHGADAETSARLAASATRSAHTKVGKQMEFHEWIKAKGFDPANLEDEQRDTLLKVWKSETPTPGGALRATQERRTELCAVADETARTWTGDARELELLRARAVAEGWAPERFSLETYRTSMGRVTDNALRHRGTVDSPGLGDPRNSREMFAATVLKRAGREALAEREYGPRIVQAAADLQCHSLLDVCRAGLQLSGRDDLLRGASKDEIIRAALTLKASGPSTYDLSVALSDAANKMALSQYQQATASWRQFASVKSLNDFKPHYSIRPHLGGSSLPQLTPGGEITHATGSESSFMLQGDTFAELLTMDRRDILNDDLSIMTQFAEALARKAASTISDVVWTAILANGGAHWSADNANLTDAPLALAGLTAAVTLLRKQADSSGRPIDLQPRSLVVSPELESTARQLLRSTLIARVSTGDQLPTANPLPELELAVEPRMSASAFTGNSATLWFLFAAPVDAPVLVGFLGGRDGPTIEHVQPPPNRLGVVLRGFVDCGVALGDTRAGVMSSGDA